MIKFALKVVLLAAVFFGLTRYDVLPGLDVLPNLTGPLGEFGTYLWIGLIFGVVNAVVGPVVEEVYFRGYLLPRLSRFGAWAPLINTVLFSLYHFFTPWQNVGRILGLLPMVYAAWWKRSIYVSMGAHVLGNVSVMLMLLPVFFGAGPA